MIAIQIHTKFNHEFGLPDYETSGAACMDVRANENVTVLPGQTALVPTGIYMAIPQGYAVEVLPRSGLSLKTPLRVANAPGQIDSDYRGELCVIAYNTGSQEFRVKTGERIAQIKVVEAPRILWVQEASMDSLDKTERGAGGFGSTGTLGSTEK
jgi:dUTP pyrophosphatase